MQVCENVEYAGAWQVGGGASGTVKPARAAVKAVGVKRRSYGVSAPVVWTVVGAAAALVPWSGLAWLFIAD
jgi:hypothetical protein